MAAPTVAVLPAAADEVSAGIAQLFSAFGQDYQQLAGQVAALQEEFVQAMYWSAQAYVLAERFFSLWLQYTIALEQSAVSVVVQDPASLLTALPYLYAVAPIFFPVLLPFVLFLAIGQSL